MPACAVPARRELNAQTRQNLRTIAPSRAACGFQRRTICRDLSPRMSGTSARSGRAPHPTEHGREDDDGADHLHDEASKQRVSVAAVRLLQATEQRRSEREGKLVDGDDHADDAREMPGRKLLVTMSGGND